MAGLMNSLATAVSPYVLPVVEKNVVPDFIVRFGESSHEQHDIRSSIISIYKLRERFRPLPP